MTRFLLLCRCSSVVEHVIGNDGVASPILASGTIKKAPVKGAFFMVMLQRLAIYLYNFLKLTFIG